MSVLDMRTGSLPPTATYARRDWVWVPASPGDYIDGRIGTLTVVLQKSRRAGARQESDTYAVQDGMPVGVMGREFLLLNETDDTQPDVYSTLVGPVCLCSCKAGLCKLPCKHAECLAALVAEGIIEPQPPAPEGGQS